MEGSRSCFSQTIQGCGDLYFVSLLRRLFSTILNELVDSGVSTRLLNSVFRDGVTCHIEGGSPLGGVRKRGTYHVQRPKARFSGFVLMTSHGEVVWKSEILSFMSV